MKVAKTYLHRGFTLVEIAIAIGLLAVMVSSFMVVFGPALKGIDKSLSAREADEFCSSIEYEFSFLRPVELEPPAGAPDDGDFKYKTPFEKAFDWVKRSTTDLENPIIAYRYRANPYSVRADGTLQAFYSNANKYDPDNLANDVAGVNYVIQTAVRRLNDSDHSQQIQQDLYPGNLVGKVYYVKLTQLVYSGGELGDTTSPGVIKNPQTLVTASNSTSYPEAVLAYRARFYEVPALWGILSGNTFTVVDDGSDDDLDPDNLGKPVMIRTMAVTRSIISTN